MHKQRPDQAPDCWFVTLEEGNYLFNAQFSPPHPTYQNGQKTKNVRPPKKEVSIDV
jgi:hypothetical protein